MFGFIPRPAFEKISAECGIPLSDMFGVATFYAQFRLKPVGKMIIRVCHGTACHVQGAFNLMDRLKRDLGVECGETTKDNVFTLEEVRCLGCCSLAPVVRIGGNIHPYLTQDEIPKILRNYRKQGRESEKIQFD